MPQYTDNTTSPLLTTSLGIIVGLLLNGQIAVQSNQLILADHYH
ncbi:hypothetical protein HMPREF9104_02125 [Lentilactobacillus kisonensis F0435]|uniref:Uncharacterized protein n=1 Tax=Lentilactobacillus kisonensis F0435 TaxID=797516 RepID=H1LHN4_9LACO|nr:hypothetical protein HMPREF9104_02125 [Lentilactobacillus kisonensis F0435]